MMSNEQKLVIAARKAANDAHQELACAQTNLLVRKHTLDRVKEVDAKLFEAYNILADLGICKKESDLSENNLVQSLNATLNESNKMVNRISKLHAKDSQIFDACKITAENMRKDLAAKVTALGPAFFTIVKVTKSFDFGEPMCHRRKRPRTQKDDTDVSATDDDDEHVSATDDDDNDDAIPKINAYRINNIRPKKAAVSCSSSDSD